MARAYPLERRDQDFYFLNLGVSAFKSDMASMELPIFSLRKNMDSEPWEWKSVDGSKTLTVLSTELYGRATMFDKELLIYALGCMAMQLNREKSMGKTIRFSAYSYFLATNKKTSGGNYNKLEQALNRLSTTSLQTNVVTGDHEIKSFFHLVEKARMYFIDGKMRGVEIELSDWLFDSLNSLNILTIHPEYFNLTSSLERRIYEMAKKHCGKQGVWTMKLQNFKAKTGSRSSDREFKRMLVEIAKKGRIPEYRLMLNGGVVNIYQTDPKAQKKVVKSLAKKVVDK